jgi:hypothetical protein
LLHLRFEGKRAQNGKELAEEVEIAFDNKRLLLHFLLKGYYDEVRVWDGRVGTVRSRIAADKVDTFALSPRAYAIADGLFNQWTYWLWNQPHPFWWIPPADKEYEKHLTPPRRH